MSKHDPAGMTSDDGRRDPVAETRLMPATTDDPPTVLISPDDPPTALMPTGATAAPSHPMAEVPRPMSEPPHTVVEPPHTVVEPVETTPTWDELAHTVGPDAQQPPATASDEPADPMADTLHPAMATSVPPAEQERPVAQVQPGHVYAGRYRLEQQLARRGGTLTWRAFDQKLSRSVLVHVLASDDPRTPDVLDAARKAAFATDSRFLRVLDAVVGETPAEPSLVVCEFAPGESLEKLLQQGPLSALEAAWIGRELADAMQTMHSEGLFHQRLNPDTVVITATGNVKIVGFLIEAAMYPDDDETALAWSEREQADVTTIGKLLYASLAKRWPTERERAQDESGQPTRTWGLAAAPMDGRGWLTPRQVRSGVSPALDVICDQILSAAPRHNEMPLRTAGQVAQALSKVLGTADGSADLERRLRYPVTPMQGVQGVQGVLGDSLEDTAQMAAVVRHSPASQPGQGSQPAPVGPVAAVDPSDDGFGPTSPSTPNAPDANRPAKDAKPTRHRPAALQQSRPPRRRWLAIVVALVALALVYGLVRALTGEGGDRGGKEAAQPQTVAAVQAKDFDPAGDNGNGQENPDKAKLAVDGNPATAWTSVVYLNNPKMGGLKPGVGVVLDLGERRKVSGVKLTMKGAPTGVQLRIPTDSATETAPVTSQKQWTTVAEQPKAPATVALTTDQAVETRFLLVYLTSLPKVSGNKYQGGIAEVEVLG